MANIKDIAKQAGVSVSTVSRVINNHPYVSNELRAKVSSTIEKLDYVSNGNAVKLSKGKTNIVGVVVPSVNHICYDAAIQGILDSAQSEGYNVLILCSNYRVDQEIGFLEMLRRKEIDGLIFISKACDDVYLEAYAKYGPIANCKRTRIHGVQNIYPKRMESYREIFNSFNNAGCDVIYVLTEKDGNISQSTREKEQVYQELIRKPADLYFKSGIHNHDQTEAFLSELFCKTDKNLAFGFYVDSDEVAVSVLSESQNQGLTYNKNLFIVSEGNTVLSKLFDIKSVDYNLSFVGASLFASLFSKKPTSLPVDYLL